VKVRSLLTGAVEVYANHAVLIVGSTAWPEVDWEDKPASADGRHVAILTRGQVAHTRVSFWSGSMPMIGDVVFDGELDLDDYTICVGDIERLGRWTQRIGQTGRQRVIVRVDDPGNASRVNVGLGIGADAHVRPLPAAGGPVLFDVVTSEQHGLSLPTERGLALDGHDSPHARLSTAIRLLSSPDPSKPCWTPTRPASSRSGCGGSISTSTAPRQESWEPGLGSLSMPHVMLSQPTTFRFRLRTLPASPERFSTPSSGRYPTGREVDAEPDDVIFSARPDTGWVRLVVTPGKSAVCGS
jgi:hypothetical protein